MMRPAPDRTIRVIRGRRKASGLAKIQIPFLHLGEAMDVELLIINGDIRPLLSFRDIYKNGMDL